MQLLSALRSCQPAPLPKRRAPSSLSSHFFSRGSHRQRGNIQYPYPECNISTSGTGPRGVIITGWVRESREVFGVRLFLLPLSNSLRKLEPLVHIRKRQKEQPHSKTLREVCWRQMSIRGPIKDSPHR